MMFRFQNKMLSRNFFIISTLALLSGIFGVLLFNIYLIILSSSIVSFLLLSNILFVKSIKKVEITSERKLSKNRVSLGSEIKCDLRVELSDRIRFEAEDLIPEVFDISGENRGTAERSLTLSYLIKPTVRGVFGIGPTRIRFIDPFDLFYTYKTVGDREDVIVFPDIANVKKFDLASRRRVSELVYGLRRSWHRGFGTEFLGLREYVQGDDPRNIDWKATARFRKLFTREFEAERRQRVIIALDCGRSMYSGELKNTMLDKAVNASILLSHIILKGGDLLGFCIFSNSLQHYLPPNSGRGQFSKILESMAFIDSSEDTNFKNSFDRLIPLIKRRAFIILISDLNSDYGEIKRALKLAVAGKHRVLIIYTFPPRFEGFEDETTRMIASAAEEKYTENLNFMKADLIRYGIHIVPVGPETIIPTMITRYTSLMERGVGAR